jgi:hypothetical protein
MKRFLALILILSATACTTISNQYHVAGDSNRFSCESTAAPIKTITPSISAAASQSGSAEAETK